MTTPNPTPTPIPAEALVDSPWPFEVAIPEEEDEAVAAAVETSELWYMSCSNGAMAVNVDIVATDELSVVVYGIERVARSTAAPPEHCAVGTVDEEMDTAHF